SNAMAQSELDIIKQHVKFVLRGKDGKQWHSMPELPTAQELNPDWDVEGEQIHRQLLVNDITTPYRSKGEYLETLYRIQREEGITQIRHSIKSFKENPRMYDDENTFIYTKVFVQGYSMTRLGPLCRIEFSTERAGKKIRWTHTRRLTPGTLVVISTAKDSFKKICKPAIIADRMIKGGLDRNPSVIQIQWARCEDAVMDPTEELIMLEARLGFYEAVRHCMVGLQHVAESDTSLDKYLVHADRNDHSPDYVKSRPQINLMPLVDNNLPPEETAKAHIRDKYHSYDVLEGIPTEIGRYTSLDNSQLEAVHRILTKELAIIQGPPGTGKTYTSVQALRVMLETQQRPTNVVVVAAETNHAVDQILIQLIKLNFRIVRLGGRTKDEEIKRYNMFNLRKWTMLNNSNADKNFRALEGKRKYASKCFEDKLQEVFPSDTSLLDPEVLMKHGIITKDQFNSLLANDTEEWQHNSPGDDSPQGIMGQWLGGSLVDVPARRYNTQLFDTEEFEEDDEFDENGFNPELDDCVVDDDDEDGRQNGYWVPIERKWAGSNDNDYTENDLLLKRQLIKPNLWNVESRFRGAVYEHWQRALLLRLSSDLHAHLAEYVHITKDLKINRWNKDTQCIKTGRIQIVGCTTTGLCKYRGLLAALKPRTILIEEAAQSQEANITSALYQGLQQLILVGDHQQLVPHCDTAGLAGVPFFLGTSLFERLVIWMDMPFTMLNMQRRMIPAIRELLVPHYKKLTDHPVVKIPANRPPVPGMLVDSFLFHHTWPEGVDTESLSKHNIMEAEMVVGFVRYLLMNGVRSEKVTVLTFYRGQRKKVIQIARQKLLHFGIQQLNVYTVDSYQGEENDIVILSLVRSNRPNDPGRAGFVQDRNRGVVSISRARRGFYVFGNIVNLENATTESAFMWGNVRKVFESQGRFGSDGLPISCQNHDIVNYVKEPDTWINNHGGCWEPCGGRFEPCGHPCNRLCHPMSHSKLICQDPCERQLRCGHGCSEFCGEECRC
ncbi:P-loop containing nucleoside triphosphate hydrolase protein, partial [Pseudomassariella vexata]